MRRRTQEIIELTHPVAGAVSQRHHSPTYARKAGSSEFHLNSRTATRTGNFTSPGAV